MCVWVCSAGVFCPVKCSVFSSPSRLWVFPPVERLKTRFSWPKLCLRLCAWKPGVRWKEIKDTVTWVQFRTCESVSSSPQIPVCQKHLMEEAARNRPGQWPSFTFQSISKHPKLNFPPLANLNSQANPFSVRQSKEPDPSSAAYSWKRS